MKIPVELENAILSDSFHKKLAAGADFSCLFLVTFLVIYSYNGIFFENVL